MKKVSFMEKGLNKISELELGRQSQLLSDVSVEMIKLALR